MEMKSTKDLKVYDLVADEQGARLDKYVAKHFEELSRGQVQKLIDEGQIKVNDGKAKAGLKLNTGDRLTVNLPSITPTELAAEAIPLNIIYEDDDLLIVDKPAGLTVHPAPGHPSHTLVNALLSRFSDLPDTGDRQRPGIVHRLDKDTSGVMVVAKNKAAYENLAAQFKDRSVIKGYLVLVKGHLTPENGVIEAPVGRDSRHRQRMAVVTESKGREACTDYHVIKYTGDYTLLEVKPETGRTHQIRVHLTAIGFPVAGDKVYGAKSAHLPRQFVHASLLGFKLPSSGEYIEFTSELPPDLTEALSEIAGQG
ncbi:MAG: RluA family pseudouridine synthase [Dehalococcoidales bacterium]|jgi:23S rRNA pseudouridine1911/1915/1917 synthase|nr:RluA family pseudouridine synthase [Dehalococcoidales bacterium]